MFLVYGTVGDAVYCASKFESNVNACKFESNVNLILSNSNSSLKVRRASGAGLDTKT